MMASSHYCKTTGAKMGWSIKTGEGIIFSEFTEYHPDILMLMKSAGIEITAFAYARAAIGFDSLSDLTLNIGQKSVKISADDLSHIVESDDGLVVDGLLLTDEVQTARPAASPPMGLETLEPEVVALAGALRGVGELLIHLEPSDFPSKWCHRLYALIRLFYGQYSSLPTSDELRTIVGSTMSSLSDTDKADLGSLTEIVLATAGLDVRDGVFKDIAGKYLRDMRIDQALLRISADKADLPSVIATLTAAARFELATQEMTILSDLSRLKDAGQIIRKIPIGWDTFDEMTQGGALRPSLMVVVGKPYSGKTQAMLNMAQNLVDNGYRVLYFSMELSGPMLMMRQDAARLGKHYQTIYTPDNISSTMASLKAQFQELTGELYIVKYPPGTSIEKIRVHCDIFSTVYGPMDVIMIDYIGLLRAGRRYDSMHEEGKALAEDLAALGEHHDALVIAAAQTTKGAGSVSVKDLGEEHIGGSRGLHEVAYDLVMLSKPQNGIVTNKVQVKWIKNRSGGRTGVTSLYEIPNTFKLTDSVEEMFRLSDIAGASFLPDEMAFLLDNGKD